MNSTRDTNIVCLRYNGYPPSLPCGYGPNNTNSSNVQLYALTDNALLGATQLQASIFSMDQSGVLDELARYVNGLPAPTGFSNATRSDGYSVNATLPAQERHTISFQAYGTSSQFTTTPLIEQAAQYYSGAETTQYNVVQATDTIHSNDRLTLSGSAGLSTATGNTGISELASVGAAWRPTPRDSYAATFALGGAAATQGRLQILSDPASLRFDCAGKVAFGNAPGQQPTNSSSNSVRLSYTHQLHGGNVSLSLYRQVQNDVLLPVYVNGTVLNQMGALPVNLRGDRCDLQFACRMRCAGGHAVLPAATLHDDADLGRAAALPRRRDNGVRDVRGFVVQPYYNITGALAESTNYIFDNPWSITIPESSSRTCRCSSPASFWITRHRDRCSNGLPTCSTSARTIRTTFRRTRRSTRASLRNSRAERSRWPRKISRTRTRASSPAPQTPYLM